VQSGNFAEILILGRSPVNPWKCLEHAAIVAPVTVPTTLRAFLLGLVLLGCAESQEDDTPAGALMLFLEAMDQGTGDSDALQTAYTLLDRGARTALHLRAAKAQTLAGRTYHPWQMLAEGRFRLKFAPERHRMRAKIDGERATVAVSDARGEQTVQVPMVREDGAWRVVLEVPPMYQPPANGT